MSLTRDVTSYWQADCTTDFIGDTSQVGVFDLLHHSEAWGKNSFLRGRGRKTGYFWEGGMCQHFWSADGRVALLKQIKRRTFGRAKYNQESPDTDQSAEERLTQAEHVHTSALFKKILSRETDFHQVKIHFKPNQKSHSILQFASFLLFLKTHRAVDCELWSLR